MLPQGGAQPRLALQGAPLDAVVPALRHVALAARAGGRGELRRARASVALRPLPAASSARARRSSSGRRRRGRCRRTSPRRSSPTPSTAAARTATGSPSTSSRTTTFVERKRGEELVGLALPRPVRRAAGAERESSIASSRGTTSRSTRAPASSTSRRAPAPRTSSSRASTACPCSRRSTSRAGCCRTTATLAGLSTTEVEEPVVEHLRRARAARRGGPHRPPLPDLLALQDAARLPRRRRLVHLRRRRPAADARRERDGRVDAAAVRQADGRLAAQHGRLEHLAQALLRAAAALLSVRVRAC